MFTPTFAITAVVFLVGLVVAVFLLWGLKKSVQFGINALLGFAALWLTKEIFLPDLVINFWGIVLTALLGVFGYIVVILLYFVGVF